MRTFMRTAPTQYTHTTGVVMKEGASPYQTNDYVFKLVYDV